MITTGDVIEFMDNRIICGNSTHAHVIKYALNSSIRVDSYFVDPPYEMRDLYAVFPDCSDASDSLILITAPYNYLDGVDMAVRGGWIPSYEFVWDGGVSLKREGLPLVCHKSAKVFGPKYFDNKRAIYTRDGAGVDRLRRNYKTLQSVYRENFATRRVRHVHEKPVAWLTGIFGGLGVRHVLDYYAGSASALFAALNVGARYTGIEVDPMICDVILGRLVSEYPEHPVSIHKVPR